MHSTMVPQAKPFLAGAPVQPQAGSRATGAAPRAPRRVAAAAEVESAKELLDRASSGVRPQPRSMFTRQRPPPDQSLPLHVAAAHATAHAAPAPAPAGAL